MSDPSRKPGTPGPLLIIDTAHLGRLMTASLPAGVRAAELFIESRLTLSIDRDPGAADGARIRRHWETGAHLRRFSEGRHESFVLDAPGPESLESLALHPEAASVEWLSGRARLGVPPPKDEHARPESRLSDAAPSSDAGPWSPPYLSAAMSLLENRLAALQRETAGAGITSRRTAGLVAQIQEVLILGTDADPARDTRSFVDVTLGITAARDAGRFTARETFSARSLDALILAADGHDGAPDLFRRAMEGVGAGSSGASTVAGTMPVVFASPSGGFLLHEVCGHLLEADHVVRGDSPFVSCRGKEIASPLLTLVDDGSIEGMRGSLRYDDEGVPARRTPLILKGTLVGFLSDRLTAFATDGISSGNGRRQTYRDAPMPRMTNLVIDPGAQSPEEILRSTARGLLVTRLARGRVDPSSGRFALAVEEGHRIEGGRIGAPVSGAVLHGRAADLLPAIDAVGSDPKPDHSAPRCVKEDQAVAFGILQPTLRVASMVVSGGTQ